MNGFLDTVFKMPESQRVECVGCVRLRRERDRLCSELCVKEQVLHEMSVKTGRLESKLNDCETKLASLNESNVKRRLDRRECQITRLEEQICMIERKLKEERDNEVNEIEASMKETARLLEEMEMGKNELNATMNALKGKFDDLHEKYERV